MADLIRVLYVDDEPDMLNVVRLFLEEAGDIHVETITSAQKALESPSIRSCDIVVSDYMMSGMNGIAFVKAVRERFGDLPFILFTGRGREEVVIDAINNGVDFYLQKGGEPEAQFAELAHKIRQAVQMRRTRMTLAEQEQRYHDLQNASDLIQSVAPDGHFLFVNKKWLNTLGYAEEDLKNLTIFDIIHEESLEHCREIFGKVIAGENVGIIDAAFRTRGGAKVYVEGMANGRMVDGACQYTRGLFKDVTDRKLAEFELHEKNRVLNSTIEELTATEEELRQNYEILARSERALRESEKKFATVFQSSPVSLTLVSATDGMFVDVNDAFLRNTGYLRQEVIGRRASDLGLFADKTEYERFSTALREHRTVHGMELKCRIKSGEIRICRFSSGIIVMGEIPYILSTVDDISEHKTQELALQALVRSMVGTTGFDSLRKINENLSSWLGAACVMIGEIEPDNLTVQVISMLLDGKEVTGFSYTLKGTPCEDALVKGYCICPDDASRLFSGIRDLALTGFRGYVGTPLRNSRGEVMGILCALSRNPLTPNPTIQETMEIIATKAAAEIERKRAEDALHGSRQIIEVILNTVPARIFWKDKNLNYLGCNTAFARDAGFGTPLDIIGKDDYAMSWRNQADRYRSDDLRVITTGEARLLIEETQTTPAGKEISILTSKVPLTDASMEITGVLGTYIDITGRMAMETALRESELLLREVFDNANDAIFLVETAADQGPGRYSLVNRRAVEMLGYSKEELLALSPRDLVPDEIAEKVVPVIREKLIRDKKATFESAYRRKDGSVFPIEVSVHMFLYKGTEVTLSIIRDITERKEAEEALRQSEEKFRALVEHSLEGILILDPQGKILFANHAAGQIIEDENVADLIGVKNVMEFISPESRMDVFEDFRKVAGGTDGYLARYKLVTTQKKERWVESIGKTIIFEGSPAILISLRDITSRQATETALHESEEMLELVMNGVPTFLAYIDPDLRFVYLNKQLAAWYGKTEDGLTGKSLRDLLPEEEFLLASPYYERALLGQEVSFEHPTRDREGRDRILVVRLVPHIRGEMVVGFFAALNDITERKRDLEALRQANKKLNMLSGITRHDIKNQLMTLNGFAALLRKQIPDPAYEKYFSRIANSSSQITNMIQFTKEYEQIGVQAPTWQGVRELVEKTVMDSAPGEVTLKNDLPAGMEIFADPLIARVVFNLVDNSTRHGGKISVIRFSLEECGRDRIIVCEDDGSGIAADEKEQIFDLGFGKNTGFGLAISREILDITKIAIRETGEPGRGARFEIVVPEGQYRYAGTA
jgi:PAS domain S-box-containing protein